MRAAQISFCISGWEFNALMGAVVAENVKCSVFLSQSFLREIFRGFGVSSEVCGWEVDFKKPQPAKPRVCVHLAPHHYFGLLPRVFTNSFFVLKKSTKINNNERFLVFSMHVHHLKGVYLSRKSVLCSLWPLAWVCLSSGWAEVLFPFSSFPSHSPLQRQLPILQGYQLLSPNESL